jgi:Fe-S-cluster containining protein
VAQLPENEERKRRAASRSCGTCSLCCTVLRVDELSKLGGRDCVHQRGEAGCGIYETRPSICRAYQCLWMQGGLEDDERPDRTRGVVDLDAAGLSVGLLIHEAETGAFDASPALRAIAARHRSSMPVRIRDTADVLDPSRPFRVLLPDGIEHRVEGDLTSVFRDVALVERRRQPLLERGLRRLQLWWERRRLPGRAR